MSISIQEASAQTFTDVNFHLDLSYIDAAAVAFNMAMLVFLEVFSLLMVQHSINSTGGAAFGIVECKIPTTTASAESVDPDSAGVVDMEESVTVKLREFTCLLRQFYDTVRKMMHFVNPKLPHPLRKSPRKPPPPLPARGRFQPLKFW